MTDHAARLRSAWDAELDGLSGRFSLALTADGVAVSRDPDVPHYAASTMKLAVLGALTPARTTTSVTVHAEFPSAAGGLFTLQQADDQDDWTWARLGKEVDLDVLATRMITVSSNIATDLLLELIGIDAVHDYLAGQGLEAITVERLIGDAAGQERGFTNTVTAAGLAALLTTLAGDDHALDLLSRQTHLDMIPAGLPAGTWSASKGGWVTGVKNDVALVRPTDAPEYVLAVCTTTEESDADGMALVARLSAVTWEHWNRWHA